MIRKLSIILLGGVICLLGVTSALAAKYSEAPMLRTKVAAGELPPVEERLPEEPMVIQVVEEIGQYGGMLHIEHGFYYYADIGNIECILGITPDGNSVTENIAKRWEFSEGGKVFTIYLRKGIRWSDGAPFTADDILFWYEDCVLNEEFNLTKAHARTSYFSPGGEPMKMKKLDDYTVRMEFAVPFPLFPSNIAFEYGSEENFYQPKHYLKKFHPTYTPRDELEGMAKEGGYDNLSQLFLAKSETYPQRISFNDPGTPTLGAFVLKERTVSGWLIERNPYYWKVDPEGNQLPYIDQVYISKLTSMETLNMKLISGELDLVALFGSLSNYPLYMENAEKGDYRVLLWTIDRQSVASYSFNLADKDPVLRKIFRDVRFRIALSIAINREEINNVVYFGKGKPVQSTVLPSSSLYEEQFAKKYAEYDPVEANRLLDEMGLEWDKDHEYRLRPDGKRLSILFLGGLGDDPTSELITAYWKSVGVKLNFKAIDAVLFRERRLSNDASIVGRGTQRVSDFTFFMGGYQDFTYTSEGGITPTWYAWYQGKEGGEEPPEEIKRLMSLARKLESTFDETEKIKIGKEIIRLYAENVSEIGTVSTLAPVVVKNRLRNVPENGMWGYGWNWMQINQPEQFFIKE